MTIPKSQGKQAYYDARKSHWGDIFPHEPKNPPQERNLPTRRGSGASAPLGGDIGKRRGADAKSRKSEQRTSYDALSKEIKESKKKLRRERAHAANVYDFED
jgi:ribosomal protein RSM22 (predicted rRNA methylase)